MRTLTQTINWTETYIQYSPETAGLGQEPAVTTASMIRSTLLNPPMSWDFNRDSLTFPVTQGVQDYFVQVADFGYIEHASLLDSNGKYWHIDDIYNTTPLPKSTDQQRPEALAVMTYVNSTIVASAITRVDVAYGVMTVYANTTTLLPGDVVTFGTVSGTATSWLSGVTVTILTVTGTFFTAAPPVGAPALYPLPGNIVQQKLINSSVGSTNPSASFDNPVQANSAVLMAVYVHDTNGVAEGVQISAPVDNLSVAADVKGPAVQHAVECSFYAYWNNVAGGETTYTSGLKTAGGGTITSSKYSIALIEVTRGNLAAGGPVTDKQTQANLFGSVQQTNPNTLTDSGNSIILGVVAGQQTATYDETKAAQQNTWGIGTVSIGPFAPVSAADWALVLINGATPLSLSPSGQLVSGSSTSTTLFTAPVASAISLTAGFNSSGGAAVAGITVVSNGSAPAAVTGQEAATVNPAFTLNFTNPASTSNIIVVCIVVQADVIPIFNITDNIGNTYIPVSASFLHPGSGSGGGVNNFFSTQMFVCFNPLSSASAPHITTTLLNTPNVNSQSYYAAEVTNVLPFGRPLTAATGMTKLAEADTSGYFSNLALVGEIVFTNSANKYNFTTSYGIPYAPSAPDQILSSTSNSANTSSSSMTFSTLTPTASAGQYMLANWETGGHSWIDGGPAVFQQISSVLQTWVAPVISTAAVSLTVGLVSPPQSVSGVLGIFSGTMPAVYNNNTGNNSFFSVGTINVTLSAATTIQTGHAIVVCTQDLTTNASAPYAITDNMSNTYNQVGFIAGGGSVGRVSGMWICPNPAVGTHVITITGFLANGTAEAMELYHPLGIIYDETGFSLAITGTPTFTAGSDANTGNVSTGSPAGINLRFLGVPDAAYTASLTYQSKPQLFGPFPVTQAVATGTQTSYSGSFDPMSFPVGSKATISGFANAGNNGTFVVAGCNPILLIVTSTTGVNETLSAYASNFDWSPLPDWYADIYNNLFLSEMMALVDDNRATTYRQRGIAAFLAKAQGLNDTQRNAFLAQWDARARELVDLQQRNALAAKAKQV